MRLHSLKTICSTAGIVVAGLATTLPAQAGDVWFQVDRGNLFPGWRPQLQKMVNDGTVQDTSRVCIVGWRRGADMDTQHAYVIWPEGHRLIIWVPSNDDTDSLAHQTRVLDLRRDVVANERLLNGSTYLVTQDWVADTEHKCRQFGNTLTLRPDSDASK